jgi:hypothetical protein
MRFLITGRVHPERADVSFERQEWRSDIAGSFAVSCEASQVIVVADLPPECDHLDAFVRAEQVAQGIVSALGFALGTGYSVELVNVVSETGATRTFGVLPGDLHFEPWLAVFLRASDVAKRDVFLRNALWDYCRAISHSLDCAHYCYRAIEAIKSAFGGDWDQMHVTLGTTRTAIDATIKDYADALRHGNWSNVKPTLPGQRNAMFQVTRDVLTRYLAWREQQPD